jgi:hypothetical protein
MVKQMGEARTASFSPPAFGRLMSQLSLVRTCQELRQGSGGDRLRGEFPSWMFGSQMQNGGQKHVTRQISNLSVETRGTVMKMLTAQTRLVSPLGLFVFLWSTAHAQITPSTTPTSTADPKANYGGNTLLTLSFRSLNFLNFLELTNDISSRRLNRGLCVARHTLPQTGILDQTLKEGKPCAHVACSASRC